MEHETLDGMCFRGEQPARQVVRLVTANVLDSSILNACTSLTIDHRTQIEKLTFRALALRQSEERRANARNAFQSQYGGQFTLSTPAGQFKQLSHEPEKFR